MKRRMAMLVAVTAVSGVLVMFAPTGTTAQAALHDACVGLTGSATLASPFTYPGFKSFTGATTSAFHVHPHSTTFTVSFNPANTNCLTAETVHASGEVHGWCGLSIGSGRIHPPPGGPSFHWVGVGGTLVVTGEVSGAFTAIPDTLGTGDSCTTGADQFTVLGAAAVSASCTPTVTMTSSSIASVSLGSASVTDHLHLSLGFASVNVSAPVHTPANIHVSGHLHPRETVCVPDPT